MNRIKIIIMAGMIGCWMASLQAKVDLVTLPQRDAVQLTIYNSADLTLARDLRMLTVMEGVNKLQFSWANTLIDPTSLEMLILKKGDQIDVHDLVFPPRVNNLGLWHVTSGMNGQTPVEISYLTSGLSWRAFYMGTLTSDEKTMQLQGYVRIANNSGEDYENAQVRLIVGKVHLLDQIRNLAQRQPPYGSPIPMEKDVRLNAPARTSARTYSVRYLEAQSGLDGWGRGGYGGRALGRPKEIEKKGLSEYFLYTIEGTETIPNGYAKRLPSFDNEEIPVVNLYKFDPQLYGNGVVRFLSFKNDEEHKLGNTPIPGGQMKVYRNVDAENHLSYEGQSSFKYIPVDEDVELNLGTVRNVVVTPTLMEYRTRKYRFDRKSDIVGWDEIRRFKIEVKNTRDLPVKVEIKRHLNTSAWDIDSRGNYGDYEKVDADTVKYTLTLPAQSKQEFEYELTTWHGTRQDEVNR